MQSRLQREEPRIARALSLLVTGMLMVVANGSNAEQIPAARQLDFFIGKWEVQVKSFAPDGSFSMSKATTHAYPILDGHAMQDDWRSLDAAGNVVFRGTSIRTYVPRTGKWVVHWAMANVPGYTYIDAEWRDGELHGNGRGFDPRGEFIERYRYYDVTPDHYSFTLERSYDQGTTWKRMSELKASKVR